jgi:acyl-coenzyme A thioesterase PaaI-like protein
MMVTKQMNVLTRLKETMKIRIFGFTQIPMIWFVAPRVVDVGLEHTEIVIPLNRRTQNHLGSMYFGSLAVGADLAGGLLFMNLAAEAKVKTSFVFKDMTAKFLKRADGDVHFICKSGHAVKSLVEQVKNSNERHETTLDIKATVPSKYGDEAVANFTLTLSVKRKS